MTCRFTHDGEVVKFETPCWLILLFFKHLSWPSQHILFGIVTPPSFDPALGSVTVAENNVRGIYFHHRYRFIVGEGRLHG
jgi:hypothetical protein